MAALLISLNNRRGAPKEIDVAAEVDAALSAKERKIVDKFTPYIEEIYADLLATETVFEKPPETLAELMAPMGQIIQGVTEGN